MAGKTSRSSTPNYYEILGVTQDSTEKEIVKSYRKKALICHPDKNPDNPKAAELFHELSEALKVLTDKKAKEAYDAVLKAKELARLRTQALDAKRKKFKQDLEAREASAQRDKEEDARATLNLEEEIKRLREEGSRLLNQQQELIKSELEKEKKEKKGEIITPKLKVKWKALKNDHDNGGYNEETLKNIFEKYGHVIDVIVSLKKNGLGIIEFENPSHALIAMEFEHGLVENPLKVFWLQGSKVEPEERRKGGVFNTEAKQTSSHSRAKNEDIRQSVDPFNEDFESMVLLRMKMAQKSKGNGTSSSNEPT